MTRQTEEQAAWVQKLMHYPGSYYYHACFVSTVTHRTSARSSQLPLDKKGVDRPITALFITLMTE